MNSMYLDKEVFEQSNLCFLSFYRHRHPISLRRLAISKTSLSVKLNRGPGQEILRINSLEQTQTMKPSEISSIFEKVSNLSTILLQQMSPQFIHCQE